VGPTGQGGGGVTTRVPRGGGVSWAGRLARGPWREGRGGEGRLGRLASWAGREGEGAAGPKWEERGGREKKNIFLFL
jgi:hypothetical protein